MCVLHLSVILLSIASCFITFMRLYGFLVPPWSFFIIFMFLRWSFIVSCTLCQSWQKGGEIVENMWFLSKILHVRGRNTFLVRGRCVHLVRGSAYFLLLVPWVLWPLLTYIILIFFICDVCFFHLPLHVLFLFYLHTHVSYYLYAIYYFCFTQRCLDEFCLKYFRNTGCQNLLTINSFLAKFFKSLC